jgi:hypothetical protein
MFHGSDTPLNAPIWAHREDTVKFMLLQHYAATEVVSEPMSAWAPEDIKAHIEFQVRLNEELTEVMGAPSSDV